MPFTFLPNMAVFAFRFVSMVVKFFIHYPPCHHVSPTMTDTDDGSLPAWLKQIGRQSVLPHELQRPWRSSEDSSSSSGSGSTRRTKGTYSEPWKMWHETLLTECHTVTLYILTHEATRRPWSVTKQVPLVDVEPKTRPECQRHVADSTCWFPHGCTSIRDNVVFIQRENTSNSFTKRLSSDWWKMH